MAKKGPQQKAYVNVDEFSIKDKKYQNNSALKKAMTRVAESEINKSSDLSTKPKDKPKGKDDKTPQFHVTGTADVKKDKVELSLAVGTWPKKSMFGFASGSASFEDKNAVVSEKDLARLLTAVVEDLTKKKVVPTLEKKVAESRK